MDSEGQSAAIPVASMEFAAICLRNALLLLPEHQQQDLKAEPGSKTSSQPGSVESSSESNDICRYLVVNVVDNYKALVQASFSINLCTKWSVPIVFFHRSGKWQEADKILSAAPSSPLRKQEIENLR